MLPNEIWFAYGNDYPMEIFVIYYSEFRHSYLLQYSHGGTARNSLRDYKTLDEAMTQAKIENAGKFEKYSK